MPYETTHYLIRRRRTSEQDMLVLRTSAAAGETFRAVAPQYTRNASVWAKCVMASVAMIYFTRLSLAALAHTQKPPPEFEAYLMPPWWELYRQLGTGCGTGTLSRIEEACGSESALKRLFSASLRMLTSWCMRLRNAQATGVS